MPTPFQVSSLFTYLDSLRLSKPPEDGFGLSSFTTTSLYSERFPKMTKSEAKQGRHKNDHTPAEFHGQIGR
jgi:hypothetical protein